MSDAPSATLDRDAVVSAIRQGRGAVPRREIARTLGVTGEARAELRAILKALEDEGVIVREGRLGYVLPDALPPVAVVVFDGLDSHGDLIGRLARERDEAPEVKVRLVDGPKRRRGPAESVGAGDRALCRLARGDDGWAQARVIKKLPKGGRKILGVVRKERGGAFVAPVERGSKQDFALERADAEGARDGDLVVITPRHERRYGLKTAKIVETVGREDSPGAPTLLAVHGHGVPDGFTDEELAQANAAKEVGTAGREDLTHLPLVTIDPEDARDHDDAVYARPDDDPKNAGGHIVLVAIADVAAYVASGTPLDVGAETRANSVYFPDRVIPMLPDRLSGDLCSLHEGVLRPCLAVEMVYDKNGKKRRHRFLRATMRSAASLTYEQAQAAIDGRPDDQAGPLLESVLKPLWAAYFTLRKAREKRSPLEIDAPERRVKLDEQGRVTSITLRDRFDAHKLIEEMMIQANVAAAESLEKAKSPLLYRVHDAPSPEKLQALSDFLPNVGLRWSLGEPTTPKRFNALLAQAAGGEHAGVVNEVVLRSQAQAVYAPDNLGHFGLNLDRYAHFTSPIRRYADLIVHRGLIASLNLGEDGLTQAQAARLDAIAEHISMAERGAMAAEREATDRYLAAFLSERVGSTFAARVTGVTRAGLFVRLEETGAEGLAPISRLGRERFLHDPAAHALIGEETGGRYTLGQEVEVRLEEVTPVTGGLLLEVLTKPAPGKRPGKRARQPQSAHRHRPPRRHGRRR